MSIHDIAVRMIENEFEGLGTAICPSMCHGRVDMAIELAHQLGAICDEERRYFGAHHRKIIDREHKDLMARMRKST
jgi:hypothetical protein